MNEFYDMTLSAAQAALRYNGTLKRRMGAEGNKQVPVSLTDVAGGFLPNAGGSAVRPLRLA